MVNIRFNFFTRKNLFSSKGSKIKQAFAKIKQELDDHKQSINENTNEIHTNYEYLCEVDAKIDKLNEKIDEISMFIGLTKPVDFKLNDNPIELTKKEKEFFMALYMLCEEKGFVTYKDVSRRLALPQNLISNYVLSLIEKGVPFIKKYAGAEMYIKIDEDFRMLQATQNILGITDPTIHNF